MKEPQLIHFGQVDVQFSILDKFKELLKDEVIGAADAFLLYVVILQFDVKYVDWGKQELINELGFTEEYLDELIEVLVDLKAISLN